MTLAMSLFPEQYSSSTLAVLVGLLIFYALVVLPFQHRKPSKLPPGTLGWPYIGHTWPFLAPRLSTTRGNFLEQNIGRYGKIFKCHLFGHPTIVSCDADFNSFILQNEDRLVESSYPANVPRILGHLSLLVVTGDVHKRLRGPVLNFFTTLKPENGSCLSQIEDNALRVMLSWTNKETLIFCEETRKFTFGLLAKQLLSLGPEDVEFIEILHNFKVFLKGLPASRINLPGTAYTKAINARDRIKVIVGTIMQRRNGRREAKMDFLDVLFAHDHLSEEEILSLVMDLLMGGYETTSKLIATVVRFLSDHPRALDELRREQERVRTAKEGNVDGRLGWSHYKLMNFTQDVIKEALRCGNIIQFVPKKAIQPIHFKEFEIPRGWKIIPIFSGVHLDPSLHSNPQQFNPWRWKEYEKMGDIGSRRNGFTPFAGGKRLCPGSEHAKLVTAVFLHHFVLNFSWDPLLETDRPILSSGFLDFKHGFPISIQPICPSH